MPAGFLQQAARSLDICPYEWSGIQYRPIDVGFRGEIHDCIELMLLKDLCNVSSIRNVSTYELISRIARHLFHVPQIAGVSEEVEIHDIDIFARAQNVPNETRADKTRPAGDKNF